MPQQAAMTIRVLATNFLRANTPNQPTRKRDHVWKKPVVGAVKINVDASFHADRFTGSCGVIACDGHGKFLGAATHLLPHVASIEVAELIAIRCGLNLGANLGCTNLAVESDCLNALEAISDPNTYIWE